jgi:hypothetical protein
MIAFLVTFGLVALLVVMGVRSSVRLRVPDMPTRRRLSGLRQSYSAPMVYKTPVYTTPKHIRKSEDAMVSYSRKAFVFSILILVMLSWIVIHIISLVVH